MLFLFHRNCLPPGRRSCESLPISWRLANKYDMRRRRLLAQKAVFALSVRLLLQGGSLG